MMKIKTIMDGTPHNKNFIHATNLLMATYSTKSYREVIEIIHSAGNKAMEVKTKENIQALKVQEMRTLIYKQDAEATSFAEFKKWKEDNRGQQGRKRDAGGAPVRLKLSEGASRQLQDHFKYRLGIQRIEKWPTNSSNSPEESYKK